MNKSRLVTIALAAAASAVLVGYLLKSARTSTVADKSTTLAGKLGLI